MEKDLQKYLDVANQIADKAREISMTYFRNDFQVSIKDDFTPVTLVDKKIESFAREIIKIKFPQCGIIGEEEANFQVEAEDVWVIDPIDGTKAFVSGIPMFTTMIGVLRRGVPVLSVIDNPVMNERWIGIENEPSMLNGANLSTSSKRDISECSLHATSPQMFSSAEYLRWMELARSVSFHHYGSESYSYCLLAAGYVELVVEADLKICDFLPVVKLIQGSGGIITDWNGSSLTIESDGHVLASASQSIHNQAIQILRSN